MKSAEHQHADKTPNTAPQASTPHISTQEIAAMTPEDVDELAQRLEQDAYSTPFEGLQDWHRLRAVAFQRSELVEPYMHLLDLEAFDES
ncbi:MAG: DUF2555 domain-containing protein [Cyanobacteria bacterium J06598_1]